MLFTATNCVWIVLKSRERHIDNDCLVVQSLNLILKGHVKKNLPCYALYSKLISPLFYYISQGILLTGRSTSASGVPQVKD